MEKIRLSSKRTFTVYQDLLFQDQSLDIEKAKVVNTAQLLRVQSTFVPTAVTIRKGIHEYDKKILDFPTIRKFLSKDIIQPVGFNLDDVIGNKKPKGKKTKTENEEIENKSEEKANKKAPAGELDKVLS